MIYAAILVCHLQGCVTVTDRLGPHATHEACLERLAVMRAVVAQVYRGVPGARMRGACAPLEELRRVVPGAYPGEAVL